MDTTLLTILYSYLLFMLCRKIEPQGLTAYYIGLFAMGMLATSLVFSPAKEFVKLRKLPWHCILLLATFSMFFVSKVNVWQGRTLPVAIQDEFLGFWAMCLLIVVSQREKGFLHRTLGCKPLAFLGTLAYSIYLVHAPLLQFFWQYIFVPLQNKPLQMFAALVFIATPLIIGFSYGFFLICERPFLKCKAKVAAPLAAAMALEPPPLKPAP